MKALTLRQPWATIVADKLKTIEVRTWSTKYRGPLVIHAGKGWDVDGWQRFAMKIPDAGQRAEFYEQCQDDRGRAIARTKLIDVIEYPDPDSFLKDFERHFNPFTRFREGLFGWVFARTFRLANPVEIRGSLGLWNFGGDSRVRVERST